MANTSRIFVVAIAVVIVTVAVVAVLLRDELRCAGFAGEGVGAADLPASRAAPGNLRIAAWNLRNFPIDESTLPEEAETSREVNVCDLEDVLSGLDAHVMVLAEVCDTKRFPPILQRAKAPRDYSVLFAGGAGTLGEHVGVAWDGGALAMAREAAEISSVAVAPATREGLALYLRSADPGGVDLSVVSVHLENGEEARATRLEQSRALAVWVNEWVEVVGDDDVIVTGSFETTGAEQELAEVDAILATAGLERVHNITGCSSYAPSLVFGVSEAALRDHVYVRSLEELDRSVPLQSWLHCARLGCADLVSGPGSEDATYFDVSDHCPITIEVKNVDLDEF